MPVKSDSCKSKICYHFVNLLKIIKKNKKVNTAIPYNSNLTGTNILCQILVQYTFTNTKAMSIRCNYVNMTILFKNISTL